MPDTKKFLGARIQEIRKLKNIKQADFAELLNIDPKHMSKIECGRCYPSFELLDRIAEKLNVPVSSFLEVEHLSDKETLITNINKKLDGLQIDKLRKVYKILCELL